MELLFLRIRNAEPNRINDFGSDQCIVQVAATTAAIQNGFFASPYEVEHLANKCIGKHRLERLRRHIELHCWGIPRQARRCCSLRAEIGRRNGQITNAWEIPRSPMR